MYAVDPNFTTTLSVVMKCSIKTHEMQNIILHLGNERYQHDRYGNNHDRDNHDHHDNHVEVVLYLKCVGKKAQGRKLLMR